MNEERNRTSRRIRTRIRDRPSIGIDLGKESEQAKESECGRDFE